MEFRKTLLVLTGVLFSMSANLAQADESYGYLLLGVGDSDTERRMSTVDVITGDDNSFEIGAGFAFNRYLSVEGSYQNFGEPDGFVGCPIDVFCIAVVPFAREAVKVDGWSVALRGAVPVTETLSVFARLGFLSWDASARSAVLNDSGTDLLYGIGLAADFNDRFGIQVSYEEAEVDIDTVKLGLRIRL